MKKQMSAGNNLMQLNSLQKAGNVITKIIGIILIITFGILTIFNLLVTTQISYTYNGYKEYAYLQGNNYIITAIMLCVFFIVLYLIDKRFGIAKLNTKKLLKISLVYIMIVGFVWVIMIQARPLADQQIVFNAASKINSGDLTYLTKGNYLDKCTFQLGIVEILRFLQNIFGPGNYRAVMLINVIAITGCFYFLFKILDKIIDKKIRDTNNTKGTKIRNIFLLMSFLCLQPIFYSVFVYGTIFGLLFSLISFFYLYKFYEERKPIYFFISFIFITLSIIAKSNFIIYAIGIGLVLLFIAFKEKQWYFIALSIVIISSTYAPNLMNYYYQSMADSANYNQKLNGNINLIHKSSSLGSIAMGMQEGNKTVGCGANGWYNGYNSHIYNSSGHNVKKQNKIAKEEISKRIGEMTKTPSRTLEFYTEKIGTQWSEPTFQTFWMYEAGSNHEALSPVASNLTSGISNVFLRIIMKIMMILVFGGNLIFLITEFKKLTIWKLFLLIIVQGGFIFSILWEAKSLYNMPYFLISMPTAAWGISNLYEMILNKISIYKYKINKEYIV